MTAIILASGFSRRFGKEKLLMKIKDKPIVLHVIDLVLSKGFREIILVFQNAEIKKFAAGTNIKCIQNFDAGLGISASIKCGISSSEPTDSYIFFTGDQPFIEAETINRLLAAFYEGKGTIIVPRYAGNCGNPVIFGSEWKEQLEGLSGDTGGRTIIKANPDKVYFVDIHDRRQGMDIDTWEDYIYQEGRVL